MKITKKMGKFQSRSQSPQAFLSSVGRLERLWDNGMKVRQDFWRKTVGRYAKQPIRKKDILFHFLRVSPGDQPLRKSPRTVGLRLGKILIKNARKSKFRKACLSKYGCHGNVQLLGVKYVIPHCCQINFRKSR